MTQQQNKMYEMQKSGKEYGIWFVGGKTKSSTPLKLQLKFMNVYLWKYDT